MCTFLLNIWSSILHWFDSFLSPANFARMKTVTIFKLIVVALCGVIRSSLALDFFFNSFNTFSNLLLVNDAQFESTVGRLTNDTNQFSYGRAFYPEKIRMKKNTSSSASSFSTSFVFSILPEMANSPGFGVAFVLSNWTSPPNAIASQYFGVFSNATVPTVAPLLVVEFARLVDRGGDEKRPEHSVLNT